jgi:PKD repeat protein
MTAGHSRRPRRSQCNRLWLISEYAAVIRAGAAASFECTSRSEAGEIIERLWDFNHGIAEVVVDPQHTFDPPGKYRVTLIVWDAAGRGGR